MSGWVDFTDYLSRNKEIPTMAFNLSGIRPNSVTFFPQNFSIKQYTSYVFDPVYFGLITNRPLLSARLKKLYISMDIA